jgi:hypothetical protein
MGIIERIVPGLGTGPPASMRIPGTRSQDLITGVTGTAGAALATAAASGNATGLTSERPGQAGPG